jgi:hypothetical protein
MSDESEFFEHSVENDYKTSLKARSYSVDTSTANASSTAETASAASGGTSGLGIAAGVAGTSAVGVVVAAVAIIAGPSFTSLPKVKDVAIAVSGNRIDYSFGVEYTKAGTLEVHLQNFNDDHSAVFPLGEDDAALTPVVQPAPIVSDSSAAPTSEGDSSAAGSSSSSSVAAVTYKKTITQMFKGLLLNRNYAFTVISYVGSYPQTIYSSTVSTGSDSAPSFAVTGTTIDYAAASLSVSVAVTDPNNHWVSGSLFATLEGTCLKATASTSPIPPLGTDGDVIINDTDTASLNGTLTRTAHFKEPYTQASQTLDLSKFLKGYVIRLRIYGTSDYQGSASSSASTTDPAILYETALYY